MSSRQSICKKKKLHEEGIKGHEPASCFHISDCLIGNQHEWLVTTQQALQKRLHFSHCHVSSHLLHEGPWMRILRDLVFRTILGLLNHSCWPTYSSNRSNLRIQMAEHAMPFCFSLTVMSLISEWEATVAGRKSLRWHDEGKRAGARLGKETILYWTIPDRGIL